MKAHQQLAKRLGDLVLSELIEHGRYHLPGFGTWTLRLRPARRIRNPVTKELMWLPSTPEVRFRAAVKVRRGVRARLTARALKSSVAAGNGPNSNEGRNQHE